MTNHTRRLDNLDAADVARYQQAIEQTGSPLSIRPGAFDSLRRLTDPDRYSLWAPMRPVNLQAFWDLVEGR